MTRGNGLWMLLVVLFGVAMIAGRCSDDDDDTGGTDGDADADSDGDADGDADYGFEDIPNPGTPDGCPPAEGDGTPDTGNCTEADIQNYVNCFMEKCDAQYEQCMGANYMDGDWTGGKCEEFQDCIDACACEDDPCQQNCAMKMGLDCATCLGGLGVCSQPCLAELSCATE